MGAAYLGLGKSLFTVETQLPELCEAHQGLCSLGLHRNLWAAEQQRPLTPNSHANVAASTLPFV